MTRDYSKFLLSAGASPLPKRTPTPLELLGWKPFFSQQTDIDTLATTPPVRVTEVHRSGLRVLGDGIDTTIPPGPEATVGDWFLLDQINPANSILLDRISLFERRAAGHDRKRQMIAANVDTVFIVTSCNRDFNVARLERFVALAFEAQVTPVILLTARGEARDRIAGFEAGADDYIPKPFEPRELVLRINAILRRSPKPEQSPLTQQVLILGRMRYEIETGELRDGQDPVRLTQTESALMRVLSARPGQVVSREALVEHLGRDRGAAAPEPSQERAIDVQITRLRRKIEPDPRRPRFLQTVRGEGYMLTPG